MSGGIWEGSGDGGASISAGRDMKETSPSSDAKNSGVQRSSRVSVDVSPRASISIRITNVI